MILAVALECVPEIFQAESRENVLKKTFTLLAIVSLCACATASDPVDIGHGRYMVSTRMSSGDDDKSLSKAIEKANALCDAKEMDTEILVEDASDAKTNERGIRQVVFACKDKP
jgi:hypothetical protein